MLFFGMGWIFFVKKLFKDYELRHNMVQLIFCINFTLSCTMFELIIFEIIDHMERSSRFFHWILALYAMLFMIILLTPFYIFYNVLSNVRRITSIKLLHLLRTVASIIASNSGLWHAILLWELCCGAWQWFEANWFFWKSSGRFNEYNTHEKTACARICDSQQPFL